MIISQIQPLTHLSSQSASFADTQFPPPPPPTSSSQPVPSSRSAARTSATCSGFPVPRTAACTARPRWCWEPGTLPLLLAFHAYGFSEPLTSWMAGREAWPRVRSSLCPVQHRYSKEQAKCKWEWVGVFFPSDSPRPVRAVPGISASLDLLYEPHFG